MKINTKLTSVIGLTALFIGALAFMAQLDTTGAVLLLVASTCVYLCAIDLLLM
jgi:hypothetical protein